MMKKVAQNPDEIGADCALTDVPAGYSGPCAVVTDANESVAVLPSEGEAQRVAAYAVSPNGGYGSVRIVPSNSAVTHTDFNEWMLRL